MLLSTTTLGNMKADHPVSQPDLVLGLVSPVELVCIYPPGL
jgi:hypothetical protein